MRAILPALLFVFAAAAPALAAEPAAGGAPGTNIEMPFLMAPMNGADGNLAGYAYIQCRVTTNNDSSANDVRDKVAFIQDAFVRDINGAPVSKPDDVTQINMSGLQARLLADARRIMGQGKITAVTILQVQIAPLHPQQSPSAPPPPESTVTPPASAAPAKAP
jgi:hypothetical protein